MTKNKKLAALKTEVEGCVQCELCRTRNNIVFSDGNANAKIILIGEAPGEKENLYGVPFVGRAGKLLDEFLKAAGISRENDLYIINTLKCRPPKNRPPKPNEKKACRRFLEAQIELVDPDLILLCGATALKSFYNGVESISKIRGKFIEIDINNKTYKSMAIFHPSYLLRNHSMEIGSPRELMLRDLSKLVTRGQ